MIEKYYEALQKRENLRENLVGLRAQIKDEAAKEQFVSMIGDGGLLLELLEEEDPKVRKNVAMILGELEWMGAADALVTAYEREQTLFVKSTYLKALAYLDITAYQERFKTRMEELLSYTPAAEEKKHIDVLHLETIVKSEKPDEVNLEYIDTLKDEATVEDIILRQEEYQLVRDIVESLPEKKKLVLKELYGFTDGEEHTLMEVGEKLGMTYQNVSKIAKKTLPIIKEKLEKNDESYKRLVKRR